MRCTCHTDDPGTGTAGIYRISSTSGATTLTATLPLKHVWGVDEGLSAYDPVTKTYIFWGTDETSVRPTKSSPPPSSAHPCIYRTHASLPPPHTPSHVGCVGTRCAWWTGTYRERDVRRRLLRGRRRCSPRDQGRLYKLEWRRPP